MIFFSLNVFKALNEIIGRFSIYLPILFISSSTKATGLKFLTLEIYFIEATPVLPAPKIMHGFFTLFKLFEFFIFKKFSIKVLSLQLLKIISVL